MLMNFWWPLEFSHTVKDKPVRVTALEQEFVIYRTSDGRAHVLSDLCVHRGGALSEGWVSGDCIVCPYHGWEYRSDGACARIPAHPDLVPPKKARIDAYPTVEKYGYIWAFLGDLPEAERPPLPDLPYFGDPRFKVIRGKFEWPVYYERALENSLDIAHAPFVHGGAFGNREEPDVPDYEVILHPYGAEATVMLKPPKRNMKGLWHVLYKENRPDVKTRTGFWMPCITLLEVHLPMGVMVLFNCHIPVDEYTTITKWTQMRTFFKGNWADGDALKRVLKIFYQDYPIVLSQRPELLPYDIGAELSVRSDAIQIAYRRMRQKYIDKGWQIDVRRIKQEYGRQRAVVIPSPARREVPELARAWVLKEVPTVQPTKQSE
ncbi:aromatic ring-hydroxylating dioxygenase subunit alpha [Chloroflexus sp.]|uniref:aromatic ring-hydroxylating dioxygenase subunit alpha n=1 Tax=Chloroflexus sp. TaxID=1904827 RepID=UPI002ADE59E9|nr:aromatic ring-hydroxylating dioxygenase subunit alpha [Chloroflexus sp.]